MTGLPVAVLGYGYLLGGPNRWLVTQVDTVGQLTVPWADDDPDDPYHVALAATTVLAKAQGVDIYQDGTAGLVDRVNALPVQVVTWGLPDEAQLMLSAATTTTPPTMHAPWSPDGLDFIAMDVQLATALNDLGLTPVQAVPRWHLVATTD